MQEQAQNTNMSYATAARVVVCYASLPVQAAPQRGRM